MPARLTCRLQSSQVLLYRGLCRDPWDEMTQGGPLRVSGLAVVSPFHNDCVAPTCGGWPRDTAQVLTSFVGREKSTRPSSSPVRRTGFPCHPTEPLFR